MTFDELLVTLAEESRYTRREIRKLVRLLALVIRKNIEEGRDVQLHGIGRFACKLDGERFGRHVVTGEKIVIPPKRRLRFVPAKALKVAALRAPLLEEDLEAHFGLKKGKNDGQVRGSDRPQKGAKRKDGRRRG